MALPDAISVAVMSTGECTVSTGVDTQPSGPGSLEDSSLSKLAPPARSRFQSLTKPSCNLQMAYAGVAILIVSIVGCHLTSVEVPFAGSTAIGFAFALVAALPLLLYLQEKEKLYLFDSILTIFWALFLTFMLVFPATIAARLGSGIALQDSRFAELDRALGVSTPGIMAWASAHWLGNLVNKSYFLLFPLMRIAILLPVLAGKVKHAQKFLSANVVAFALGLAMFALLPAIGPWYGYHLAARPDQTASQALLLLIRRPGPYLYQNPEGIICFPSFHVVWTILCAQALWGFRALRLPVSVLSGLIIFSTMTTGEHYFVDVLAGILLAAMGIVTANRLSELSNSPS
jgi:hypothetical protein